MLPDEELLVCEQISFVPLKPHLLNRMHALSSLSKAFSAPIRSQATPQLRMHVQPRLK
ncbi:MAG: hypothetical protein WCK35_27665 [Chloroflexota bacterium]